jgi:hypothetical protein
MRGQHQVGAFALWPADSSDNLWSAHLSDRIGRGRRRMLTCITGEASPDRDYEIDEALGPPPRLSL